MDLQGFTDDLFGNESKKRIQYSLKQCTMDDLGELQSLHKALYDYEYKSSRKINNDMVDVWIYYETKNNTEENEDIPQWLQLNHFIKGDNDTTVGFIEINIDEDVKGLVNGNLSSLYVKEEYRGKGAGSFAINEFIKMVKSKSGKYITLGVRSNNDTGIRLYKKLGFEPYSISMVKKL